MISPHDGNIKKKKKIRVAEVAYIYVIGRCKVGTVYVVQAYIPCVCVFFSPSLNVGKSEREREREKSSKEYDTLSLYVRLNAGCVYKGRGEKKKKNKGTRLSD
jgi:hypothetical protein